MSDRPAALDARRIPRADASAPPSGGGGLEQLDDVAGRVLERTRRLLCEAVPDCLIEGWEPLVDGLELPDFDDRHVVGAAIRAGAQVIVTLNAKDFPATALEPFHVEAQHPDVFILGVIDLDPGAAVTVVHQQQKDLVRKPMFVPQAAVRHGRVPTGKRLVLRYPKSGYLALSLIDAREAPRSRAGPGSRPSRSLPPGGARDSGQPRSSRLADGTVIDVDHFPYAGDSGGQDRFLDWRPEDNGRVLLHGHVHSSWRANGRMINVGVDVWDYAPIQSDRWLSW